MKSLTQVSQPRHGGGTQNKTYMLSFIWRSIDRCIMSRQYSFLALYLEMAAKYFGQDEILHQIEAIKAGCSFDFEWFCMVYPQSFYANPRQGVRYWGQDSKLLWPQIRGIATEEFVKPLNQIAINLFAKMNEQKPESLEKFLSIVQASNTSSVQTERRQPKPVLDFGTVLEEVKKEIDSEPIVEPEFESDTIDDEINKSDSNG